MEHNFQPLLFGGDINVYSVARAFHEAYGVRSIAYGKYPSFPCHGSAIIDYRVCPDNEDAATFRKNVAQVAGEFPDKTVLVIGCGDSYVKLAAENKDQFPPNCLAATVSGELINTLIHKEKFYALCDQYGIDHPDAICACVGGGSNAIGVMNAFLDDERVKIVLAEAGGEGLLSGRSAATIQLGREGIIHGARTLVMQTEDGQIEEPYSVSAGLDYPGIGPIHANLSVEHRAQILAVDDDEALEAAFELTRLEGIIPALESAHALGALAKVNFKPEEVVVLTVSGRGDKDMDTYINYKLS